MTQTLQLLIESLHHTAPDVRSRAALDLGKRGDEDAVDTLIQALCRETDLLVREDITWSLVRLREASLSPLLDLLHDENPATRHHAAHVLGKIADPRAVDALILSLRDRDDTVTLKAAFALSQIGDERAVPALIDLLAHKNREVQSMLTQVLEHFSAVSVELLIGALADERWHVREHAADVLGAIGTPEAISALANLMADEHWQVRFAAVNALGHIGGAKAKTVLRQIPADADQRVRSLTEKLLSR